MYYIEIQTKWSNSAFRLKRWDRLVSPSLGISGLAIKSQLDIVGSLYNPQREINLMLRKASKKSKMNYSLECLSLLTLKEA